MKELKNCLQFISIIIPLIYLLVSVFNFELPSVRFTCWGVPTLLGELVVYMSYILVCKE